MLKSASLAGFVVEGFTPYGRTASNARHRLLLMVCLMKFGSLLPAADPDHPTSAEAAAVGEKGAAYQAVFDTY